MPQPQKKTKKLGTRTRIPSAAKAKRPPGPKTRARMGIPDFPHMGPRQSALIRALQGGKYPQGVGFLYNGGQYDPLGIACILAGVEPVRIKKGIYTFDGVLGVLPPSVIDYYHFYGTHGNLKQPYGIVRPSRDRSLVNLSDSGQDFSAIATRLLACPKHYFRKMA